MPALDIAIDVSHWQGVIDWAAVRSSGILITMIKATEGSSYIDPMFERNWIGANSAGIFVIPYHFMRPGGLADQIPHFHRVAQIVAGSAFALDWEGKAGETATPREVELMGEELAGVAGRPPLGYWGIPGSTPGEPTAFMLNWSRWVARYPKAGVRSWQDMAIGPMENPEAWWLTGVSLPPLFAQYTSEGHVPGVNGHCDRSVGFFASVEEALAWCHGGTVAEPLDVIEQILAYERFQEGVEAYQRPRGLGVDGRIGPLTLRRIGEDMRKP